MDDLYNNAWGDPSKPAEDITESVLGTQSTWSHPKASVGVQDDEADLAAPSWSTGAGISWDEPSNDEQGFGWSQNDSDLAWGASTYEGIHIAKPIEVAPEDSVPTHVPSPKEDLEFDDVKYVNDSTTLDSESIHEEPAYKSLNGSAGFSEIVPSSPSVSSCDTPHGSRPQSPDGFGTFESAVEEATSPGFSVTEDLEDNAWGTAWSDDKEAESEPEEQVDEWEAARRQKEAQDRKVPPEVVADIMAKLEEACKGLCPEPKKDAIDTDPSSWRNNLGRGMDGIEGLEDKMRKYAPDLTLEPPIRFDKTGIYQNMITGLKLTRSLPMVKQSPMSIYMSMKGSTAWESAIKDWKGNSEEDVVPVGWRILEKDQASETTTTVKAPTTTSRMFSFWGRKQQPSTSTPGTAGATSVPLSSSKTAPVASSSTSASPRPSIDSTKRSIGSRVASPVIETPPTSFPTPPVSVERAATPPSSSSLSRNSTGTYADAELPELENSQSAPSAVSRFLNRFSRRRSALPTSPNSSISLSSDDLSFLSEIVPSAADDDNDDPILSLSKTIKAEPLPPMLPPPPGAPSPLGVSGSNNVAGSSNTGLPGKRTLPLNPHSNEVNSLFDSFQSPFSTSQSEVKNTASTSGFGDLAVLSPSIVSPTPASTSSSRSQSPASASVYQSQSAKPTDPSPLSLVFTGPEPSSQPFAALAPPDSRSATPTDHMGLRNHNLPPLSLPTNASATTGSSSRIPSSFKSPYIAQNGSETPLTSPTSGLPLAQLYADVLPPPLTSSAPGSSASGSSRPTTPLSAVPLSQLYPGAQMKAKPIAPPPASNRVKTMSDQRSVGLSAFTLPPPPSSRSGTPVVSSTSRISNTGMAPLLPPPAAPPSRAISPPSVPTISFDDDDFDDFQSGSTTIATTLQAPSKPISVPPLQPPITLAKPASIVRPNPIPVLSPLSLPPSASSSLLVNTQVNRPSPAADLFEDDFADFHSASPSITQHPSSFSITTSVSSNHGLLNMQGSKSSGFDDFSVLSPVLRTPTPPKPPSKLPLPAISAPKNDVAVHPSPKGQSKAARHQHTLSLVELAASRKGQWPAPGPPSPLPQPLSFFPPPPPSSSSSRSSGLVDLMGEDEPLGNFSSAGSMASLAPAPKIAAPNHVTQNLVQSNGFSLLAPSSQSTQSIPSFGSSQWLSPSNSAASIKSNGSSGAKGAGKLSAQDLSFFEGL